MRIALVLSIVFVVSALPTDLPLLGESGGAAWARKRRRRKPRPAKRSADKVSRTAPLTWHGQWVHKTYGAKTLAGLKSIGITAKTFWYANQNARAGIIRLRKGKHADGFYLLNKAYKLVASPNILYHLAMANQAIGRWVRARDQLARFLKDAARWRLAGVSEKNVADAQRRINELQTKLVELRFAVNVSDAVLFLDNRLQGRSPFTRSLWVRPKRPISMVLLKPGHKRIEKKLSFDKGGKKQTVRLEMLTNAEAVRRHKKFLELERKKQAEERRRRAIQRRLALERLRAYEKAKRRQRALRLSGWSSLGVGGAALITGVLFAVLGEKEFNKTTSVLVGTPWPQVEPNFDRSVTYRTVAYATLGTGAALGLAGAVLLYFGYRPLRLKQDKPQERAGTGTGWFVAPTVERDGVMLSIGGSL